MQLQRLRLGTGATDQHARSVRWAVLAVVAVTAVLALAGAVQDGLGGSWGTEAAGDGGGGVGGERGSGVGGEVGQIGAGDTGGERPGMCRGWVGLTFDDGPVAGDGGSTRDALRVLEEYDVPATFFFVGQEMFLHPELVAEVRESAAGGGMQIGSESWSHPDLARGLSAEQVNRELVRTAREYESIVGEPIGKLWRPPYGSVSGEVRAVGESRGMALTLWTVDAKDYGVGRGAGWEKSVAGIAARALRGEDGGIVLLHAGHPATVEALGAIIRGYWARGMCFGVLAEGRVERAPEESPGLRYRVSAVDPKKVADGNANLADPVSAG